MTRQEVIDFVKKEYGTNPEYLWERTPDCAVFRNKDNKWYGIIMDVSRRKFGFDSDELVDVLNVKADPVFIDMMVGQPGFYRAYHMNKTQWISVFLDGSAPAETIKAMLSDSYAMTSKKRRQSRNKTGDKK